MKKRNVFLIFCITLSMICISSQYAQTEMVDYTWGSYNMAFSIPNTLSILESDSVKFSASDSNINFTLYPVDASGINSTNMETLLSNWALANDVEVLSGYESFTDEDNYSGILCVGSLNSSSIMLILCIDPLYPSTGFYIWISYNDNAFDTVLKIVDSFHPM
jgi:hypothetical protein